MAFVTHEIDFPGTNNAKSVYATDIDGAGSFTFQQEITNQLRSATSLYAADLDGDGDIDLLTGTKRNQPNALSWFENTDGAGTFGSEQVFARPMDNRSPFVFVADLNGDGNLDVLSSTDRFGRVEWYENSGMDTFGPPIVIFSEDTHVVGVHAADLDGDGDLDVISALHGNQQAIAWFENIDGAGVFSAAQMITSKTASAWSVHAADLDGDGDIDVLSTSSNDNSIWWCENRVAFDSNDDGRFDSRDLVLVFQLGKYEDDMPNNATFDEGDWNGDGDFNSIDLVTAFQSGTYQRAATTFANVAAAIDWLLAENDDSPAAKNY